MRFGVFGRHRRGERIPYIREDEHVRIRLSRHQPPFRKIRGERREAARRFTAMPESQPEEIARIKDGLEQAPGWNSRVVAAAPKLGLALGYDVAEAAELAENA